MPTLTEIERDIQIVEDNLRELEEQASSTIGAGDEERVSSRIADQQEKLDKLRALRAEILGETS